MELPGAQIPNREFLNRKPTCLVDKETPTESTHDLIDVLTGRDQQLPLDVSVICPVVRSRRHVPFTCISKPVQGRQVLEVDPTAWPPMGQPEIVQAAAQLTLALAGCQRLK